jgi:Peptidase family S41/N-terminal domain of Peptidase_S41 in eukaryotic IRBP
MSDIGRHGRVIYSIEATRDMPGAMPTTSFLLILFAVIPGLALADVAAPPVPDSPAGHALSEWLDAFNSGDRATFESFAQTHAPWLSLDGQMQLRERTGGYDLLSIDKSEKLWIVFRTRERASSAQSVGRLIVRSYDPDHITLLSLDPAGESSTKVAVDEAQRIRVIDGAVKLLNEFYVFPDVAEKVSAKLRAQHKHGAYRNITDAEIFAIRLTDDLVALSGDKHIGVDFFARVLPAEAPASRPHPDPRLLAQRNCGFEKAEHYSPNIGYLKLNSFDEPEQCAATAIAAMNFLADSDALIVDLRDCRGGAPRMAVLISSYLFDEPTHLDDIYDRGRNTTEQLWTFAHLPGKKFTGKPIFVLTSAKTFSAGEQFGYDLKALKRATLIGETTGGGAHTMAPHRIDDHFFIRVPFGRFINPVTKTDWEGTGVEPDVKVPAAEALDVAKKLAAEEIGKNRLQPAGNR